MTLEAVELVVGLLGLVALALASERQATLLSGRLRSPDGRWALRAIGWTMLSVALLLAVRVWGWGIGAVGWLGGLGVAGVALAFFLSRWSKAKPAPVFRAGKSGAPSLSVAGVLNPNGLVARVGILLLVALPLAVSFKLASAPVKATLRSDVVRATVGPWTVLIAETNHRAPELAAGNIPVKSFDVRFCVACDTQILAAYLRVGKPRSPRRAGTSLDKSSGDRRAEIPLPSSTAPDSELWLTVEGKDGSVHQTSWRLGDIAPRAVEWFAKREEQ